MKRSPARMTKAFFRPKEMDYLSQHWQKALSIISGPGFDLSPGPCLSQHLSEGFQGNLDILFPYAIMGHRSQTVPPDSQ